jgi:small conductance mechanosensitive channel
LGRHWLTRTLERNHDRVQLSPSMRSLFVTIFYYGILICAVIIALYVLGVPQNIIIGVVAIVFVLLGIALNQSLGDLAATVIFFLFKPFTVGEYIAVNTTMGTVQEIQLFNTTILTYQNLLVTLPNGTLQNSVVINYSRKGTLRLNIAPTVSYDADIGQAKALLLDILAADARVLPDPAPQVLATELTNNGVTLSARATVNATDFWNAQYDLNEIIKRRFDEAGIRIAPQRQDVQIHPSPVNPAAASPGAGGNGAGMPGV